MPEKEIDVFIQNLKSKTTVLQQLIVCIEECKKLIGYTENIKQMVKDLDIESANSKLNELETSLGNLILTVEGIQGDVNNLDLNLQDLTDKVNNIHIYCHSIRLQYNAGGEEPDYKFVYFNIYNNSEDTFTLNSLKEYISTNENLSDILFRDGVKYDYTDNSQQSLIKNITISRFNISVIMESIHCSVYYWQEGENSEQHDSTRYTGMTDLVTRIL